MMIATRMLDDEWKLIGCISLVIILVTPLGSNNYVWPILNNLFFIAPVTFWMIYRFVRWGRTCVDSTGRIPFFPAKAMAAAMAPSGEGKGRGDGGEERGRGPHRRRGRGRGGAAERGGRSATGQGAAAA